MAFCTYVTEMGKSLRVQIHLAVTPPVQITPTTSPTNPTGPTLQPHPPHRGLLIVQYEEISCYYGYSDIGMHTIFN